MQERRPRDSGSTGTWTARVVKSSGLLAMPDSQLPDPPADSVPESGAEDSDDRIGHVKPQVLIVDLGMPEMDGFEFIKRVRASPDSSIQNIPAAALTAFARSEDRTKALRSGFEMHLAKPVDPGELVASVATLARRVNTQRDVHS